VNIHGAYHQGQFQQVVDFDTSSFSSENKLPAQVLKLRAQIALGNYNNVISEVRGQKTPDLVAAGLLAQYLKGDKSTVEKAKTLAETDGDELGVQILAGTVLARAGLVEEALAVLVKHQGSLDAFVAHMRNAQECVG
jgi:coatomer protein complex subunit epsilon